MTLSVIVMATAVWLGWCYWRRCEREKRAQDDFEYWEQVRRECPSCATRRREKQGAPVSSS